MSEEKEAETSDIDKKNPLHFAGKDALGHVAEAQALGLIASAEEHGTESPGSLSACADAARDTAFLLLLLTTLLNFWGLPHTAILPAGAVVAAAWILWKLGRAARLGWARLERLHRVLEQERWEIQHHRQQERQELKELYAAKGFQGKLLEDILDVLMADGDRLLRVMVEEEMGLSLQAYEHPLRQGSGAALGALAAAIFCLPAAYFGGIFAALSVALLVIGAASATIALYEGNRLIPACIWNIGIGILSFSTLYFLLQLVNS